MSEFDSPNYAEYTYDKKNEGRIKKQRGLMLILYIAVAIIYFAVCCITKLLPLIAIEPILIWILVFFTWKYVSYDCYFVFDAGMLELGTVKVTKNGRRQSPRHKIHVKEALLAAPLVGNEASLSEVQKVDDLGESETSENRILIIYNNEGVDTAVIFEGTAKIAKNLVSFCPNAQDLKGKTFHG
ncbi:MAG: hypothetical protein J6C09_02140 [Clostridia bacterium]|nr:hypothetical protein [Clostridia bacterium]